MYVTVALAQNDARDSTLNRSLAIYDVREEMYSVASWALLCLFKIRYKIQKILGSNAI